jgi:putative hydrolase of the HAD superfamily
VIKALMVDVDGVLICGRPEDGRHWSTSLEADLGVRPDDLHSEFFAKHWDDIVIGRARLEDRLPPVLERIAPHVVADQLIDYWFARDARVDHQLIQDLRGLQSGGIQIHLATNQEHRRAQYIMCNLGLAAIVDGIQYSAQIGARKPDAAFFQCAASRAGLAPMDVLLIDDTPENVSAARVCGWEAVLWTGEDSLLDMLKEHLPTTMGKADSHNTDYGT